MPVKLANAIILTMPKNVTTPILAVFTAFLITLPFSNKLVFAGTTPPTTTYVQTPSSPDGNNDWYVTPVRFDLTATDLESGVSEIRYRVDSGAWQTVLFSDTLNLTQNPSFETAGATSTGITNWEATLVDADTIYSQDTSNFFTGYSSSSAKITSTGGAGVWHGINNYEAFAVAQTYENMSASLWMKTENVSGIAYFKIYSIADDGFGGELRTLLGTSGSLSGTNNWTNLTLNFTVLPENTTGVYIDIGLEGSGTIWADAVVINSSSQTAQTSVTIASDSATHTFEFYAIDKAGNTESHSCTGTLVNCVQFKLDSSKPGNWSGSGAIRGQGGSEHELFVFTNVTDPISGLAPATHLNQYIVDNQTDFGHFENLIACNTPWLANEWVELGSPAPSGGETELFLQTQKTDFCNSNWKICKTVRFYAEDMAGNITSKDFCINGPWLRFRGEGVVHANQNIDMLSEPEGDNTDGLIEVSGNGVDFFTSSRDWEILGADVPSHDDYDAFWAKTTDSKTEITGDLPTTTGVFYTVGNYTVNNQSVPNNYDDATFNQVVFINGDLTIDTNIDTDAATVALFVVKGNVNAAKGVDRVQVGILSDGIFNTAYDISEGQTTGTLELNGIFSANNFIFSRTLQGTNNDTNPSEDFVYEPKFLIQLRDFFGKHTVTWR